jgi:hypothetical protein
MFLPQLQHLPKFLDFSPDDDGYTCIFPLAGARFRRCLNPVNKRDRQSALALRVEICALDPFEDSIDLYLQSYAQFCCCIQNHRAQMGDPPLLKQQCLQWKKQLRSAHVLEIKEAVHFAATHTDDIEVVTKDSVDELKGILHQDATTLKNAPRGPRDGTPDPCDELKVVNKRVSLGPQDLQRSSPDEVGSDDDFRIPMARPRQVVQRPTPPVSQVHQCQPKSTTLAAVPLRTIQTRSQTGSLPWFFTPRRRPAEKTMLKTLTDPINEYSSQVGVIYLYTRISDPGFIKFGCTVRDPAVRMREWEKSCGYKPDVLYVTKPVPNVRRLESLLKRDLSLQGRGRQETYCKHNKHCPKNHTEWFEISLADALLLVDTWVAWMREASPYRCIAKAACKNAPVAVIREEWRQYFESSSQRNIEIRSHCLQVHMTRQKVAAEHHKLTCIQRSADGEANPEYHVSEAKTMRTSLVQAGPDTLRKEEALQSRRKQKGHTGDEAFKRSYDDNQLVDTGILDRDIAAIVTLACYTLWKTTGVDGVASSSTSNASILSDTILGPTSHASRSRIMGEKPLRQIMAC